MAIHMANLEDINGVSDSRADDLRDADFVTVDDIATAEPEDLTEVSGIGEATAEGLIESAQDVITSQTLGDDEGGEEEEGEAAEEEQTQDDAGEDDVPEVTEEDLQELVENEPEGEPGIEDVTAEDDDAEPREVEVVSAPYDVTISLDTDAQYDYFYFAIIEMKLANNSRAIRGTDVGERVIEQLRGMQEPGDVELSLSRDELNSLYAAVKNTKTSYQGVGRNEAFLALRSVEDEIQAAREEYIL